MMGGVEKLVLNLNNYYSCIHRQVESWALLCGSVAALQDRILQAQGVFANLCKFDFLLITPEKLRLTHEGGIEIDSGKETSDNNHKYLHPEVLSVSKVTKTESRQFEISEIFSRFAPRTWRRLQSTLLARLWLSAVSVLRVWTTCCRGWPRRRWHQCRSCCQWWGRWRSSGGRRWAPHHPPLSSLSCVSWHWAATGSTWLLHELLQFLPGQSSPASTPAPAPTQLMNSGAPAPVYPSLLPDYLSTPPPTIILSALHTEPRCQPCLTMMILATSSLRTSGSMFSRGSTGRDWSSGLPWLRSCRGSIRARRVTWTRARVCPPLSCQVWDHWAERRRNHQHPAPGLWSTRGDSTELSSLSLPHASLPPRRERSAWVLSSWWGQVNPSYNWI